MGAFLQPPGLSLLRGGVIAVVVQEERPDLPADARVNPTKENGLSERGGGETSSAGVVSGVLQKAAELKTETKKQTVLLEFTAETWRNDSFVYDANLHQSQTQRA